MRPIPSQQQDQQVLAPAEQEQQVLAPAEQATEVAAASWAAEASGAAACLYSWQRPQSLLPLVAVVVS